MRKVKVSEFAEVITGGTPSTSIPEYWDNGTIPWLQSGACQNCIITDCDTFITQAGLDNSAAKMMKPDSVLIALTGATTGKVGYLTFEACANQSVTGIQPNESFVPKYLYYYLLGIRQKILDDSYGGAQKHISQGYVKNLEIPLGTITEQKNIVEKFDHLSQIISFRQQELDRIDNLIKARFVEMFGHPESNEKGWEMKTFGDICTVRQGLQIPISKRLTEYEKGCYEYITVQYLHGGKTREYIKNPKDTVICTKDDVLMTRTGNTGMVITGVDGVFHNNFFLIDFNREIFEKNFLVHYLNLDIIQAEILRRAGTSTIPDLNHGEFYKIHIFEPPLFLQRKFDLFLKQIDKSKLSVQKSLDKTQLLFDSLMQQYFG